MAIKKLPLIDRDAIVYASYEEQERDGVKYSARDVAKYDRPEDDAWKYTLEDVIAKTSTSPIQVEKLRYFHTGIPRQDITGEREGGYELSPSDWWYGKPKDGALYVYQGAVWHLTGKHRQLSEEHQKLLVMQEVDKERKDFERLKRLYDSDATKEAKHKREPIPEDVRIAAWRRDEGKCVQCDSNERLEYDHIIPVSKGGSNTVRNIQLLCETCNRQKSDSI